MRKAGDVCFAEVSRDSEGIAFTYIFNNCILYTNLLIYSIVHFISEL